jgi:choice-of-anchor B domain-containing protein
MKNSILIFFTLTMNVCFAQTPCDNGFAGSFPCEGYDLISQIPLSVFNSVKANDSWGWTDPLDDKEYAIICLNEGTVFIDVSDPLNPIYLGQLPGQSPDHTTWRDVKTYNNYAFIVSEDSNHGMQIFDLTRLRNVANPPETFDNDAYYDDFGSCHNIVINEASGFAYAVGSDTFSGGPHFVNIQDPINPVAAGGYTGQGYTHDAHVVLYAGPDTEHQGKEIFFGANETHIVVIDVTDKGNPVTISTMDYANVNYTHQGWLTEDHRYFLLGDETDEINIGINSRTLIFDLEDLDNPQFHFEYFGPTGATDHNGYVHGNNFYLANNAAGLRVIDISDIASESISEIGFFDSYPSNNNSGFNGSWSIYPFFESGNIVISDRAQGFLLVAPSEILSLNNFDKEGISYSPNPVNDLLQIQSRTEAINRIRVTDMSGKVLFQQEFDAKRHIEVDFSTLSEGVYLIILNDQLVDKIVKL